LLSLSQLNELTDLQDRFPDPRARNYCCATG
jgi:hypothetical protein